MSISYCPHRLTTCLLTVLSDFKVLFKSKSASVLTSFTSSQIEGSEIDHNLNKFGHTNNGPAQNQSSINDRRNLGYQYAILNGAEMIFDLCEDCNLKFWLQEYVRDVHLQLSHYAYANWAGTRI